MGITKKTMIAVVGALALMIAVLNPLVTRIVMTGFLAIEDGDVRKNVSRALDAYDARLNAIETPLLGFTQWDDAYAFMADRNPEFVKSNVSATLYTGSKINYVLFVNLSGEILVEGGYDLEAKKEAPVPDALKALAKPGAALAKGTDVNVVTRGTALLPGGPALVASAPVTNTDADKPHRGYVVFARLFDGAERAALASVTHLELTFSEKEPFVAGVEVAPLGESTIAGRAAVADIAGKPVLGVEVRMPRSIYLQGRSSVRTALVSIGLVGVIFALLMAVLLRSLVLSRVTRLAAQVQSISTDMDFNRQVDAAGSDEISSLAGNINGMIAGVAEFIMGAQELERKG